jgi:hypothetical protein
VSIPRDYSQPADVYLHSSKRRAGPVQFRKFPTLAEAVQFAIEGVPSAGLTGVSIESGDERYEGKSIIQLYQSAGYPLDRPQSQG